VTGSSLADFDGRCRKREYHTARTLVSIYILSNNPKDPKKKIPITQIGKLTGGRDHCSIINDRYRYMNLMSSRDEYLTYTVKEFIKKLKNRSGHFSVNMTPPEKII
jgi:chromosomal replication initiation ATPase DnaA